MVLKINILRAGTSEVFGRQSSRGESEVAPYIILVTFDLNPGGLNQSWRMTNNAFHTIFFKKIA